MTLCMNAMGDNGGIIVSTLPPKPDLVVRNDVNITPVLSYTAVGNAFRKGDKSPETPAKPGDKTFARTWWNNIEVILQGGQLRLSPLTVQDGGLEAIGEGLDEGRSGLNGAGKGGKIVYRIGS